MKTFLIKSKGFFLGLILISVIGALLAGVYWVISSVWEELISIDAKLAIGIVAAVGTVFGATLTVTLGKYFERKQAVEAHFRERKVEIYDEFLKELFKLFGYEGRLDEGFVPFLQEWKRKMVVWGGSNVLLTYIKWITHLSNTEPDAETMFFMGDFLLAMRKDLGLSNKGIDRKTFAYLIMRHPDLFLEMAGENPRVTMAEIANKEKELGLSED